MRSKSSERYPEIPESKENSSVHERLAGAVGHPSRVSREGKAGPLEAGRGKYSPPANPERVTAGASERRDGGVLLQRSRKERLSRHCQNTCSESPETPVKISLEKRETEWYKRKGFPHLEPLEELTYGILPIPQSPQGLPVVEREKGRADL
jgi:hypothetical protein